MKDIILKKEKIFDLLFGLCVPELKYFDMESDKLLDEKIEVLQALKDGKQINEIPKFYEVLELLPKEMWD